MNESRGFALAVILVLALSIGANILIFGITDAVLLRPLPYANSENLAWIWENNPKQGFPQFTVSAPKLQDWSRQNSSLTGLAAIRDQSFDLEGSERPERLLGVRASASLFSILGVDPLLGRTFLPNEELLGAQPVVILSHELWVRRFGSDSNIINKSIDLDGRNYTVIGVMKPDFWFPSREYELWVPLALTPAESTERGMHVLRVMGRLKSGVSIPDALSDFQVIASRLAMAYPNTDEGWGVTISSARQELVGDVRPTLLLVSCAVGLVLFIGCLNIASLLLARALGRKKEISIRSALGARRSRIVRQLITESVVLAFLGTAIGVFAAYSGRSFVLSLIPKESLNITEIPFDSRVMIFVFGLMILTAILFGLVPALQSSKADLNANLKEGGQRSRTGTGRTRIALLVAESSFALVLLVFASLLIQSLWRLEKVDPGFRSDHLLTIQFSLPPTRYQGAKVGQFYDQLLSKVRSLPGVTSAATIRPLPLSGSDPVMIFDIDGRPPANPAQPFSARYRSASSDYFHTLGIALRSGRQFTDADNVDAPGVAIINETMAHLFFPGENPIGQRIKPRFPDYRWCIIVGVAGNVRHTGLDKDPRPEMYYPYSQLPEKSAGFVAGIMFLAVRTNVTPTTLIDSVRAQVAAIDSNQPVFNVRTMDSLLADSMATRRFSMILLIAFAVLGLLLIVFGIYSLFSFFVNQRTEEIGIRMALGARNSNIARFVVKDLLVILPGALVVGSVVSVISSKIISSLLYQVKAADVLTFVGAGVVLVVSCFAASLLPLRRALNVDPVIVMRQQ